MNNDNNHDLRDNHAAFKKMGLLPYQAAFAANDARFKIGLWARQTGKDHTATAEAVLDCLHHPGITWIILAASERQALESLAKAREWAQIVKLQIDEYSEAPANIPYSVARTASTEIKWSNGSRLIALPANPATIRGYSANLILTEFAFHENPEAIWRAIYPSISNPLRGGRKKLRIISTPNGLTNKFAHLWFSPDRRSSRREEAPNPPPLDESQPSVSSVFSGFTNHPALWLKSRVTIHDAIASGLPLDPAELQAGLNDPEAWAQEYLCEFADNSTVLLPYELIEACESSFASERSTPESLSASALPGGPAPQLFAGIDFARKNHLTVCWILERLPITPALLSSASSASFPSSASSALSGLFSRSTRHLLLTREVLCLRNLSTPDQIEILRSRLNLCRKICLDYTGPGIGFGDYLHREFSPGSASFSGGARPLGASFSDRIELCPFTSTFKAELFPRLAAALEARELLIPIARDLREDLHSIYRVTTNSGQVLYRAHATPDGHADRTTALALALRAAQTTPLSQGATSVGPGFRSASRSGRSYDFGSERTLAVIY